MADLLDLSRRRLAAPVVAVAAALVLAACGGASDGDTAASEEPADSAAEAPEADESGDEGDDAAEDTADVAVPAALDFETNDLDGATHAGADLVGEPAVMWFWAPWCSVCRGEAPDIADAVDRHAGNVEFYGIPGLGEEDEMVQFVSDTGTGNMTHLVDGDGSLWSNFGVTGQPAFVFLEADGEFETVAGTLTPDDLDSRVAELTG